MKKVSLFFSVLAIFSMTILFTNCKKDSGPAGADGTDGTNGTNGTNGANGADGYGAVTAADQAAYDAADGMIGGRLYDSWLEQFSLSEATPVDTAFTNHEDFFRCNKCHGWDLLGSNGAYANRAPNTTRPAVSDKNLYTYAQLHNIKEIFNVIKHAGGRTKSSMISYNSSMPDYSLIMSDARIWQLVKFLKKESFNAFNLYDMTVYGYYPTATITITNIGKDGDAVAGKATYATDCASCHGANGKSLAIEGLYSVGWMTRNKPYAVQNNAKFGHPKFSAAAPHSNYTESVMKNLLKATSNTTDFPDL